MRSIPEQRVVDSLSKFYDYPYRTGKFETVIKRLLQSVYKGVLDPTAVEKNRNSVKSVLWFDNYNKLDRIILEEYIFEYGLCYFNNKDRNNIYYDENSILKKIENPEDWAKYVFLPLYEEQLNDNSKIERTKQEFLKNKFEFYTLPVYNHSDILTDTEGDVYLTVKNAILQVKEDSIIVLNLKELNKKIFENNIKPLLYNHTLGYENWKWLKVYKNFSGDNFDLLKLLLGKNIYRFKSDTLNKISILIDGFNEENKRGGTGKTVIARSLKYLRNVVELDNIKGNSNFIWQSIENDTEVIILNESQNNNIKIEDLRNFVDNKITIQQKFQKDNIIEGNSVPRLIITANNSLWNEEDADIRRLYIFAATNYYSKDNPIYAEMNNKMMYSSFDDDDWSQFLNFMIHCVQVFLKDKTKIDTYNFSNLIRKKRLLDLPLHDQIISEKLIKYLEDFKNSNVYSVEKRTIDIMNELSIDKFSPRRLNELIIDIINEDDNFSDIKYLKNQKVNGSRVNRLINTSVKRDIPNSGLPFFDN
jgi:hypothetical protein